MRQLALDIGLSRGPSLHNFLAGPNAAALAHLQLWVGSPTRSPVPIYLWGESGSGKTHLLRAVREAMRDQGARVGWMDPGVADPVAWDDAWALVLMDDVGGYGAVQQQAAFNWFINAQGSQRGVLAAGSLPPTDLTLREDLRSRLGWGHVFHLQCPNDSERRAVLRQASDARGVFLSDEVMDFMQRRFSRDLSSLMELLDQLDGYSLQTKRPITVPLIKAMLEDE